MIKLDTIQKRENLNSVYAVDEKGNGGAYHRYFIAADNNKPVEDPSVFEIQFQNGPRHVEGSLDGVLDTDLLEIVKHRLECFQHGPFNSTYNARALEHVELALMWMNRRVEDRIARNVLGKNEK